jgi:CBS domain-containing protein
VEDQGRIVGIVTKTDILKALKLRRDSFPAIGEDSERYQYSLTD